MLLASCHSASSLRENFDTDTGTTWFADSAAFTFARTETRYSRSARDYVYLGPVAINRRGTVEYFVWVGIATTLDRGFLAPEGRSPDRLVAYVNDEPLELELIAWTEAMRSMIGSQPYEPAVQLQAQLAARVTLDQLRLLSASSVDSILIGSAELSMQAFFPWRAWTGWPEFLQQTARLR